MIVSIIAGSIFFISLAVISIVVSRKIPQLRLLDPKTYAKGQVRRLKSDLLTQRLQRLSNSYFGLLKRLFHPAGQIIRSGLRTLTEKLGRIEARYQRLQRQPEDNSTTTSDIVKRLLEDGVKLMKEERYGEAEQRLIEALSHDAKNVAVYEELGVLYLLTKQLEQAEEALRFALKIHPNDASVLTRLGEVKMVGGSFNEAKRFFAKAVLKRPKNPRYLDFLIEAAIRAGDSAMARRGLEKLRKVNPENAKLAEFAGRIIALENRPAAVESAIVEEQGGRSAETE